MRRLLHAFSLLELLMVVAIIGLLAALLLPGLNRSRLSARRVQCMNSLRQLGVASHLYCDENSGICFRYNGGVTNYGQNFWFGWLGPGGEAQRAFDITQGALYPYIRGRGVEICPSLDYAFAQFKLKATGAAFGYGCNRSLAATAGERSVPANRIGRPADTAVLADAAQVNVWQAPASASNPMLEEWYYVDTGSNQPNGHFRHSKKAGVVFWDAHVGPEKPVPGSIDPRLPSQYVGRLRNEILELR